MSNPPPTPNGFQTPGFPAGVTSVQHTSYQTTWSAPQIPQQQQQQQQFYPPPMLPGLHQQAMAHHHMAMQHHNVVTQGLQGMSLPPIQQVGWQQPAQQQYQQPQPMRLAQAPASAPGQLQIANVPQQGFVVNEESDSSSGESSDSSTSSEDEERTRRLAKKSAKEQRKVARAEKRERKEERERAREVKEQRASEQRAKEQRNMTKEAQKIHDRMDALEKNAAADRQDRKNNDKELRSLKEQHESLQQLAIDEAKQHKEAVARAEQTSRVDISQLIQNEMSKHLTGFAKTSDLEASTSRMEKKLQKLPEGASDDQVQKFIRRELDKERKAASVTTSSPIPEQQIDAPSVIQPNTTISRVGISPQAKEPLQSESHGRLQPKKQGLLQQSEHSVTPVGTRAKTSAVSDGLDSASTRRTISSADANGQPNPSPESALMRISRGKSTPATADSNASERSKPGIPDNASTALSRVKKSTPSQHEPTKKQDEKALTRSKDKVPKVPAVRKPADVAQNVSAPVVVPPPQPQPQSQGNAPPASSTALSRVKKTSTRDRESADGKNALARSRPGEVTQDPGISQAGTPDMQQALARSKPPKSLDKTEAKSLAKSSHSAAEASSASQESALARVKKR